VVPSGKLPDGAGWQPALPRNLRIHHAVPPTVVSARTIARLASSILNELLLVTFGGGEFRFGGRFECFSSAVCPINFFLRRICPPRFVGNTAKCDARGLDFLARIKIERSGHTDEREGVARAGRALLDNASELRTEWPGDQHIRSIHRARGWCRAPECCQVIDENPRTEFRVRLSDRARARSHRAQPCHTHIARMSGNALFALAEDGVNSIVTVNRAAAAARIPFIARWELRIVEIIAASSLQKIAADRGHVAQLRTCTRQQRFTQNRIARFNQRVLGQIGIADHRSDAHAFVAGEFFNLRKRQTV